MVAGLQEASTHIPGAFDMICFIRALEINPWPPSQAMESIGSPVILQWISNNQENSGSAYGRTITSFPAIGSVGKLVFRDSASLYATLYLKVSSDNRSGVENNYVGFNLYQQQGALMKHLGTATINLTDYPILQTPGNNVNIGVEVSRGTSAAQRLYSYISRENEVKPKLYLNIVSMCYQ